MSDLLLVHHDAAAGTWRIVLDHRHRVSVPIELRPDVTVWVDEDHRLVEVFVESPLGAPDELPIETARALGALLGDDAVRTMALAVGSPEAVEVPLGAPTEGARRRLAERAWDLADRDLPIAPGATTPAVSATSVGALARGTGGLLAEDLERPGQAPLRGGEVWLPPRADVTEVIDVERPARLVWVPETSELMVRVPLRAGASTDGIWLRIADGATGALAAVTPVSNDGTATTVVADAATFDEAYVDVTRTPLDPVGDRDARRRERLRALVLRGNDADAAGDSGTALSAWGAAALVAEEIGEDELADELRTRVPRRGDRPVIDPDDRRDADERAGDRGRRRRLGLLLLAVIVALGVIALTVWAASTRTGAGPGGAVADGAGVDAPAEASEPTVVDPPTTEPPATEPPDTDPPTTEPPDTEPPATEPPVVDAVDLPLRPGIPPPPPGPELSLLDDRGHRAMFEPLDSEIARGDVVVLQIVYRQWGNNGFARNGRSIDDTAAWCRESVAEGEAFRPVDFERVLPIAFEVLDAADPDALVLPGPDGVPMAEPLALLVGNQTGLAQLERVRLTACGDDPLARDPDGSIDAWWDERFAPLEVTIDTSGLPTGTYVLVPSFDFRSPTWISGTLPTVTIRDGLTDGGSS